MMSRLLRSALLLLLCCTVSAIEANEFNKYWYSGESEITSYSLEQVRYGEIHTGTSVMIFVTEPFSKSKHVKLDNWRDKSEDNATVMKLNKTKKFLTGVYPYSMMLSTFKSVDHNRYPKAFKVTSSSQEWCGHTWLQANLRGDDYQLRGYSYFESESDVDVTVKDAIMEDELWTRIRLNPAGLPVGNVQLLPSTFYLRLKHKSISPMRAKASLDAIEKSDFSHVRHLKYSIQYDERVLTIFFEEQFPHVILGWEEVYPEGAGKKSAEAEMLLITKAKKMKTIKSAYWEKNGNADRAIRKRLNLPY